MEKELRHVGIGLLLGVIAICFGIFWAVYMTVKADAIHRHLTLAASSVLEEKFVISQGHEGHSMHDSSTNEMHSGHEHGGAVTASEGTGGHSGHSMHTQHDNAAKTESELKTQGHGHGWGSDMEAAHERLAKGHVHAMGLGLLTICLSLMLAWIRAPHRVKTLAAASIGTGTIFYPLAWIIMGYRTTALGAAAAQASVLPMVGLSVLLIAAGLLMSFAALVLWLVNRH